MALAFLNDGASANPDLFSTSNASSYANTSWTPSTSGLEVCIVANSKASAPDAVNTLTGNGITWVNVGSIVNSSSIMRLTMFAADLTGATTGATTADFNAVGQTGCCMSFFRVTGVDLSGGVAAAFVQVQTQAGATSQTSGSVTLNAAGNSNNRPISAFIHAGAEATTFRTNWTELDDGNHASPNRGFETQYRSDAFETTASATWTTSSAYCAIAAEIKCFTGYTMSAGTGSYSLSGVNPSLLFNRKLSANVGSYSLSGVNPTLRKGYILTANVGSYALTGVSITFPRTYILAVSVGSYALSGVNAGLLQGRKLAANTGSYTLTGVSNSLLVGRRLSAGVGNYALSGVAVNLLFKRILSAGVGAYTLTGVNPSLLFNRKLSVNVGAYLLTGLDVTFTTGGGSQNYTLTAGVGSYALTGGQSVNLLVGRVLHAAVGAYGLTGNSVIFTLSGNIIVGVPVQIDAGINGRIVSAGVREEINAGTQKVIEA